MVSPTLWFGLAAGFVIAGLLNIARSRRSEAPRRTTRLLLGIACFAWAVSSVLFGLFSPVAGAIPAGVAVLLMVGAAAQAARKGGG